MNFLKRQFIPSLLLAISFLLIIIVFIVQTIQAETINFTSSNQNGTNYVYLPILQNGDPLNCRFGINAIQSFDNLNIDALPMGWYVDYSASSTPVRPNGATFVPIIRLTQTGSNANDYTFSPSESALLTSIAANPGSIWLIGNEPDRRDVQDDIEPHVYAAAYKELYNLIKTADPSAQVFAGTIVQPSPIRLQYLDMILAAYANQNSNATMPVDGWSIHNFLLNEVSCDYDPANCWGAEIPPGINANFGEILTVDDNDDIELFKSRIRDFRQWMKDNGYGELPLTVSEYGILMPDWLGFDEIRVNTFMNASFDYMLNAIDPTLGDPNDNYRLVQTFSWYSTGNPNDAFNGYLFEGTTFPWDLSPMGQNYTNYVSQLTPETDFYPSKITSNPPSPILASNPVTVTLNATIANSGNKLLLESATIRFFEGNPQMGGTQIGNDQLISLSGCGDNNTVSVEWTNVTPGNYEIYVTVTEYGEEIDDNNNVAHITVIVNN